MNKKFFILFMTCISIISILFLPKEVMATNVNFEPIENSGETIYLKDYEEYEALMNEVNQNEVNKQQYLMQIASEIQKESSELKTYQAKVLSINKPEMQYTQDQSTRLFSSGYYQNGEVEIINDEKLEGITLTYMMCLTYDVYGNIVLPEIKVGDVVNVSFMQMDEENVVAFSPEPDTYIRRFPTMIIFAIIMLVVIGGVLGKYSVKLIIPVLLSIDILIGVVGPLVLEGISLWLLVFFAIVLTTIAICVLKLGVNVKSVTAILTTVIVSVALIPVHFAVDALFNFSGLTSELFLMSGGVLPKMVGNELVQAFSFHSLSISITLIMSFALVALVACKVAEKSEVNEADSDEVKSYVADMSFVSAITIIATALPKYMLLLAKKYTAEHLINSEMLLVEFVRLLIVMIAVVLTIPVTKIVSKFLED